MVKYENAIKPVTIDLFNKYPGSYRIELIDNSGYVVNLPNNAIEELKTVLSKYGKVYLEGE